MAGPRPPRLPDPKRGTTVESGASTVAPNPVSAPPTGNESHIGQLLLRAGKIKPEDVRAVVRTQRERHMRFGDAAVELGLVSKEDIQRALALQYDFPYLTPGQSSLSPELYAAYAPMSAPAEALRGLRAFLSLRALGEKRNSIAVIGPRADDSASALAANLAIVFAQLGERTLLVDANLRAPGQAALFGRPLLQTSGLSAVLGGRQSVKDAIAPIPPFGNLHLLPSGPLPPNPQELLGRLDFAYIMETLPGLFDVVIVDAPPVLEYPDAMMVSARVSHCLMAARRHRSRVADQVHARSQLEACGASMLGAVLVD